MQNTARPHRLAVWGGGGTARRRRKGVASLAGAHAGNLPRELTSFVGRQPDVARVSDALRTAGLVTLVGIGGVGKTRLALRVAGLARDSYASGAWLVELTSVSDPTQVAAAVAAAVGVRERHGWDTRDALRVALRGRQVLIVLDNCEHVLQGCAELVAALLQSCEDLTLLATSREPLRVPGEAVYAVSPLPIPDAEENAEQLVASDAVQLLIERVRVASPGFELTPGAARLSARICHLVDGLPLAIELAAARASTMTLAEITDRLDAPLHLLTLGPRTAPLRQQTLRSTIDWSYALLTDAERALLCRLAVFSAGCTLEAARAVCGDADIGPDQILDLLDRLVGHSLVAADTRQDQTRFSMLDTLRQYCLERLEETGETRAFRQRHCDWCLALVAAGPAEILDTEWVGRLMPEVEDLRAAWRWLVATGQFESAARLAVRMATIWNLSGRFSDGRATLTAVLEFAAAGVSTPDMPRAGIWAAILAANQGDYFDAENLARQALRLAYAAADEFAVQFADNTLGWLAFLRGDLLRAQAAYEHTYAVAASPNHPLQLLSRHQLVVICTETGDLARAAAILEGLSAESPTSRSRMWVGRLLLSRAQLAECAGDYVSGDRLLAEAITAAREVDDQPGLLQALVVRGAMAVDHGDRRVARTLLTEAVEIAALHGSKLRLIHVLEAVANLVLDADPRACVRVASAAEQLRSALGAAPLPSEQARLGRFLQVAKQRVGERAYAALWRGAQVDSLEAMLADARSALHRVVFMSAEASAPAAGEPLSGREREVAVLVARGFSNREIADELVISLKTVEAHVHHVLNKLGLTNRVQIATWGLRRGVVAAESDAAAG